MTHPSFDTRTDFHTIASARECPQAPANCLKLEITSSSATAHMSLLGAGASGSKDLNNLTPLFLARQFGAVKFWMGFPWNGSFEVTDIILTRKK